MNSGLVVAGAGIVLAAFGFLVAGPVGAVLVGLVVLVLGLLVGSRSDGERPIRNCPSCGSILEADDEACDYCGTGLEAENQPT